MIKKISLKNIQRNQNIKKKKILFLYKKIQNLIFILKRIKYRSSLNLFYLKKKHKIKIFHNNKFFFNIFFFKAFIEKKSKSIKILNNYIYLNRDLKLKQKKLKKKKILITKYLAKNTVLSLNLYNKVLSLIFKVGKKNTWNLILNNIFELLYYTLNYTITIILSKIFIRLYTKVEIIKAISRKRITYIPMIIKPHRSIFLALKWIFLGALKNLNNTSFKNKLYIEFIQLLTFKTCFSIQKMEDNNLNSFKNRSNLHFRWHKSQK